MTYALSLRLRALVEIESARDRYALVGHGDAFLDERLKRYPFAAFFRVGPETELVVILAVFPQRDDPSRWPG